MLIEILEHVGYAYQAYRSLMFDAGGYIFAWEMVEGRNAYIKSWFEDRRSRRF